MSRTVNTQLQATTTGVVTTALASSAATLETSSMADVTAVIAGSNPSNVTFDTGTMEVQTHTYANKAGSTTGDYVVFYDTTGTAWAIALDTAGTTEPSDSPIWDAVAADHKVVVDLTAATTAASVAALVELAVDALTGFTAVIVTSDGAADGTMTFTQTVPGPVSNAVPGNDDDSGVGSITVANTTQGVASEVNITSNAVSIPAHGLQTGVKITELTSTGTLPAGLSTSTAYYAIVVDSGSIKFAVSQANALTGTAVDITGYGTSAAVHTVVIATTLAGTIVLQKNNSPAEATAVWVTLLDDEVVGAQTASVTISAAATVNWTVPVLAARQLRALTTITSGTVTADIRLNAK